MEFISHKVSIVLSEDRAKELYDFYQNELKKLNDKKKEIIIIFEQLSKNWSKSDIAFDAYKILLKLRDK